MSKRVYADRDLWRASRSLGERLLAGIGADPEFIEAVVGDLAEEYAERAERDGVGVARAWYAREWLRTAPHVLRSAIRHSPRARARVSMLLAALALTVTLGAVALMTRNGPPAHLVADAGDADGGIVVNNVLPVTLAMRVLDEAGHKLESSGVRYRWAAGAPITVSPGGVVKCTHHGDATVRASLGDITTSMEVLCRPVLDIRANSWIDFVAGDPARHLPFEALGVDGLLITQLRGSATVMDTSVAKLVGSTIAPRAVGRTMVEVKVGDREVRMGVRVHELVRSLEGLRPDQRLVATPVRLAQGDTVHWPLPTGMFWLKYLPRSGGDAPPTITVEGPVSCRASDGLHAYRVDLDVYAVECSAGKGASVKLAHGKILAPIVEGRLAIERMGMP
jgi:hypothetical protein